MPCIMLSVPWWQYLLKMPTFMGKSKSLHITFNFQWVDRGNVL